MDYITATRSGDVIHPQLRESGSGYETRGGGGGGGGGVALTIDRCITLALALTIDRCITHVIQW